MEFHKTEKPLRGEITIPGDKSISHRSVMFGAISQGTTEITNFLQGQDCLSTISCFRKMGIEIENTSERILVHGRGLHGLTAPTEILDVGKQRYHNKADLRYSRRTGFHIRTDRRCIDPETSDGTHHQTVIHDGCHD